MKATNVETSPMRLEVSRSDDDRVRVSVYKDGEAACAVNMLLTIEGAEQLARDIFYAIAQRPTSAKP